MVRKSAVQSPRSLHRMSFCLFLSIVGFSACISPTFCSPDWMARPGTIAHALTLADGSAVSLDAEIVDKIVANGSPAYFVIRECFDSKSRIVVSTQPSPALRLRQTVDVQGVISTLSDGQRVITSPTVYGYTDRDGNLLRHGPLIKGTLSPVSWQWKMDLTVRDSVVSASGATAEPSPTPAERPDYYRAVADVIGGTNPQSQGIQTQSLYPGIPEVRGLPDSSLVELQCKRIIGVGTETIDGTEYEYADIADDLPATDSIRAYCTANVLATDRLSLVTGQIRHVGTTPVICVDTGPSYDPQILEGYIHTAALGSIAYVKTLLDGSEATINGKVITAYTTDLSDSRMYVEEQDGTSGVLVHYTGSIWTEREYIVDVTGTVSTLVSGERWIEAGDSGVACNNDWVTFRPHSLANNAVGGSDLNTLSLGVNTPPAYGLNNIGSLITTWGRVTGSYPAEKCFYVDDGSNLDDTNSHGVRGLKVSWEWQRLDAGRLEIVPPPEGCFVTVTGVSSMESIAGDGVIRVLRPREAADIHYPQDTAPPYPGMASALALTGISPITVSYAGASDDYSGINRVELWYRFGEQGYWMRHSLVPAASSGSFTFTPSAEGTHYFDLVAVDNAGNSSDPPSESSNGDCSTLYDASLADVGTAGRIVEHCDYLYPGGLAYKQTVFSEDGNRFRQVLSNYGLEGELRSVGGDVDPVSYTYDALYRVKTIMDGRNNTTLYIYDDDGIPGNYDLPLGLLRRIEYPGGDVVQFSEYDAAGRVLRIIDPSQTVVQFGYSDPEDLPTDILYPATPGLNVHFSYDPVYGRLAQVQDGAGIRSFTYDNSDVPNLETSAYSGLPAQTIQYQYYPNGSLMTMSTPAGAFGYTYDAAGRPVGMTNPFGEAYSWSYLNNDWLQTKVTPASSTTYGYNQRGFVTDITNRKTDQNETLLSQFTAPSSASGYDPAGNLLTMVADVPGVSPLFSGTTNYSYSNLDQLLTEQSTRNGGYSYAFQYDSAGNPTTLRGAAKTYNNAKNQNDLFTYDANGNPRLYKGNSLDYDAENRLTSFGATLTAGYTSDGLRAWKETSAGRRYYLYSGWTPVCELVPVSGALVVSAVNTFGPNGLLARREIGQSTFYTFDPQGSVVQALDSSGNVLSTQLYDAYGSLMSGTPTYPYGFCARHGYYTDSETGLQLLSHRYYDPAEGRFLTRDPIGYAGGLNLYAYANGNPVNTVDPSGFQPGTEWADYTARYWEQKTRRAKEAVLDSNIGVCGTTVVNSAIDVFDGIMHTPSTFAHLGEGLGCWAGGDHSPDAVCRAWSDVGTFSSTVLAVSLGPAMRGLRAEAPTPEIIQGSGGPSSVYALEDGSGQTRYVGQTTNQAVRARAWARAQPELRSKVLAENLTPLEADGAEQLFVEGFGGSSGYSNGGSLINRINVIGPKNPYYGAATDAARRIMFR